MKAFIRIFFGAACMMPFVVVYKFLQLFSGRKKAGKKVGSLLLHFGAVIVRCSLPAKKYNMDFNQFRERIRQSFLQFPMLYDIRCIEETPDSIMFETRNCPLTAALKFMGVPELAPCLCGGDFLVAKENHDSWRFQRTHSLGTDGVACNHHYRSKMSNRDEQDCY